jgi:hypothetical protein
MERGGAVVRKVVLGYILPAAISYLTLQQITGYQPPAETGDFSLMQPPPPLAQFLSGLVLPLVFLLIAAAFLALALQYPLEQSNAPDLILTVSIPLYWFGIGQYLSRCEWGANRLLDWRFPAVLLALVVGFFGILGAVFTRHGGEWGALGVVTWSLALATIAKFARLPAKN